MLAQAGLLPLHILEKEFLPTKWRTKGKGEGASEECSSGEVERNNENQPPVRIGCRWLVLVLI